MANLSNLNPELLRVISEYSGFADSLSLRNTSSGIRSVFTDRPIETIRNVNTKQVASTYVLLYFVNQFVNGVIYMATREPYTSAEEYVQDLASILTLGYDMKKPCGLYAIQFLYKYAVEVSNLIYGYFIKGDDETYLRYDFDRLNDMKMLKGCDYYINPYILNQEILTDSIFEDSLPSRKGRMSVAITRYLKHLLAEIWKGKDSVNNFLLSRNFPVGERQPTSKDTVMFEYRNMVVHWVKMALEELEANRRVSPETVEHLYETQRFADNNGLSVTLGPSVTLGSQPEVFIMKDGRNVPLRFQLASIRNPISRADFSDYGLSVGHIPYPYETMTEFDMRRRPSKKRSRKPTKKRSTRKGRK